MAHTNPQDTPVIEIDHDDPRAAMWESMRALYFHQEKGRVLLKKMEAVMQHSFGNTLDVSHAKNLSLSAKVFRTNERALSFMRKMGRPIKPAELAQAGMSIPTAYKVLQRLRKDDDQVIYDIDTKTYTLGKPLLDD